MNFFARIFCPGSLPHILIESRLSSQMARLHTPPFPLRILKPLSAGKLWFCWHIHPPLKVSELRYLGCIAGEGQRYGSTKNGLSRANHQASAAAKLGHGCSKTPVHVGHAWRRPSPVAVSIRSQATVLAHHLKPFSGLRIIKQQNY